ncbi:MAG: hypothetical protein R3A48_18045 [Polyangiales bacterium]
MRAITLAFALALPSVAAADPAPCPEGLVLTAITENGVAREVCAIRVNGRPQRPYPFGVTARSALRYQPPAAPRSFVPLVPQTVRRAPF